MSAVSVVSAVLFAQGWFAATPPGPAPASLNAPPDAVIGLVAFVEQSPRCPDGARRCFGVALHVVVRDGQPVRSPAWVAEQVSQANRHFAPIGVGFEVIRATALPSTADHIESRSDRDGLGRERFQRGPVNLFVVGQLDNVDDPGVIRGVHWRLRSDARKRWIIMSQTASSYVFAHELGHFFGLPHSRYPISIMNKQPRADPPWTQRTFATPELKRMRKRLRTMLRTGLLDAVPSMAQPNTERAGRPWR